MGRSGPKASTRQSIEQVGDTNPVINKLAIENLPTRMIDRRKLVMGGPPIHTDKQLGHELLFEVDLIRHDRMGPSLVLALTARSPDRSLSPSPTGGTGLRPDLKSQSPLVPSRRCG